MNGRIRLRTHMTWVALLWSGMICNARADFVNFNFESVGEGTYSNLSLTQSGLTATIFRELNHGMMIQNTNFASFGLRSLRPDSNFGATAMIANFSQSISSVRLDYGDFGADTDTIVLQVFSGLNATGTLLGQVSDTLPGGGNNFSFLTLSVASGGINSIRFIGGSLAGANSVYYDNILVERLVEVPVPAGVVMMGLGGAIALGCSRFRRKTVIA